MSRGSDIISRLNCNLQWDARGRTNEKQGQRVVQSSEATRKRSKLRWYALKSPAKSRVMFYVVVVGFFYIPGLPYHLILSVCVQAHKS